MGVSSDGQLHFGVVLKDGDGEPLQDSEVPSFVRMDEEDGDVDLDLLICDEMNIPRNNYAAVRDASKEYPVALEIFCSFDYSMYILRVNVPEAEMAVRRGYHEAFSELPAIPAAAIERFKAWCSSHDLEPEEPKWILSSLYG